MKGSHGRAPTGAGLLLMSQRLDLLPAGAVAATDMFDLIRAHVQE